MRAGQPPECRSGESPAIQPNYLATQADKDTLVAGLRIARKVFRSPAIAALVAGEWLDHIAKTAGTTFHPTSTCMMGPHERAVVSGNTNAATIMIAEKGADLILAAARSAPAVKAAA